MKKLFVTFVIFLFTAGLPAAAKGPADNPRVRVTTSLGVIELELDAQRAPGTVRNFMNYVESGFYSGTIFHRVIPGFMIQGGGFRPGMDEKVRGVTIRNEADNGLKNLAGTIAMARTPDPHSAAAQFFINTVDNPSLDHRDKTSQGWGYTVFGKVTKGMDVVHKIEQAPTHSVGPFQNVPVNDVTILKVEAVK
ncbi:MAG: peptidylprolyl isomerase [Candidatus Muproteobacteria bacterium RIFCSPHIGHO2_12_FULL_60_33]|uniref:Peptidyl-prolyl cis-trans isomerase n=1 Tax=Candidatus Muproteobacteria bacterium RIFCSPLOWO2_01_FULL_60_18 TaxID=1817768 RepID=A0A1F6U4P7_9PROT|nr:MAG: peptidylprolyl isomerase [Candidatus Muproteobacteria bacterium RIFCSPLOWO2_01_FULL_60_18]OGI52481.1 MAG: peptidylprolyl isomerase [Candidatus Muproteobacteria bacterium RIFCSPHIGHO2_01_60_12]OGI54540.1 MAG: peptidylprolyl isomerase [Candidatus Muproteobacteria bacterium RIFCSPHIGHO2_12_FULL_60_33]OGI55980.1 MAG: peptidylprolyl isomerase [Candidatus Muproteobacteria bacterium RIFCSPHIGHO2_02_FULL_60_13]OGI59055.1 MAG: peptidylprolyl isomerase [Candidatus Muproteobacteria bacterium RIFCS